MSLKRLLRSFTSAKVTVSLLIFLSLLLLLNVVIPQKVLMGEQRYGRILESAGPGTRWVLEGLGFGSMATSPVFLTALGLFFLNLAMVLASRLAPTWRRIALRQRSEEGLKAWARMEESYSSSLPEDWQPGGVARILRGFGFQVRRPGDSTFWGVKHRTAPLGFLLFHLSFFLICGGGVLIYYTRFVGVTVLSEGQQFDGGYSDIVRQPPTGRKPELNFALLEVDTRLEDGLPAHLGATLRIDHSGGSTTQQARVNHPARWGPISILVEQAGLAPVLWLQDEAGFTRDRVVTPARTRGGAPTEVPMDGGNVQILIHPLASPAEFPAADQRSLARMRFQVLEDGQLVFDDNLQPGQVAELASGRLVLEELRYWANFKIISERGGGLLIAGFSAGIMGLIWRLLWYRREVAVTWDEQEFRLVGRSEYFSDRFRSELEGIFEMLQRGGTS